MKVHVLAISHQHGVNTYVCATYERALLQLWRYVAEWWVDMSEQQHMPLDHNLAIEWYFHDSDEHGRAEFYDLTEQEVLG